MEPISILGAVSFAITQLSFILLNLSELNKRRQKWITCKDRLDDYILTVGKLKSQYQRWQTAWSRTDVTHYRAIWSDQYDNILQARKRIRDLTQELERKIREMYTNEDAPEPRQDRALPVVTDKSFKLFKRVAFALSTDTRLSETIERLKTAIENITDLSEGAFARRIGNARPTTVTAEDTERLRRLVSFFTPFTDRADAIHKARLTGQIFHQTDSWELELGKLDRVTNIKEWDQWDPVEIRFAFRTYPPHPDGTRMSLWVLHQRDVNDNLGMINAPTVDWQQVVCGNGAPRADVRREPSAVRQCRPFGCLFRDGFFEDSAALKSWEPHRAELILSLASWVLLLWGTDWTSDLCSFRLRSVCTTADHTQNGHALEVDHSTLSADGPHRGDCNHHRDKLRNFGILLAELITATTIRRVDQPPGAIPIQYQKWSRVNDDWLPISAREIIRMVHAESNFSNGMRDVVKYCLEDSSIQASAFEPGHLLKYIVKIYEPIEKWCKDERQEAVDFDLDMWPRVALEPDPAQRSQTWLEFAYRKVVGYSKSIGVAFIVVAIVAVLVAWPRGGNLGTLRLPFLHRYISDDRLISS